VLVAAAQSLEPPEVVSNAAVLMFGGIDTTEGMITNAVLHLLTHNEKPDESAVEESVRLEPAAAVVDRYATRDVELGGASIRRGDLVIVSIAGANRDPSVFPAPDRFDARRANARLNLAFAQGPHFCLGAQLARAETLIAIRKLFSRLPDLRLDGPSAPRGLVFRKPPTLAVRWEGRV
jgi:cytochrome P450